MRGLDDGRSGGTAKPISERDCRLADDSLKVHFLIEMDFKDDDSTRKVRYLGVEMIESF